MAEAGVGKSRLYFEFKAKNQSGWMVLETFSVSHGKASAFLPVIDLLWSYFEITSDDDERKRREKINGKVLTLDRSLEDALPYLHAMLGLSDANSPVAEMEPQARKRRSLEAIKRILLRESLNQPLIVIFEDLHWIDDETQALLNLLADSIANAKILLLVNYRPEYSHQWGSKTYYTQLRLDPLGKESADEMLSALLGDGAEMAQLKRVIIERTEGNPFFMEETVQVLLDEGALVRDGSVTRLTRPLGELKIPPTVQGILAARIDRLPSAEKDLLQTLAVIGREFPLSLISAVIPKSDDELSRMLNDLQLGEFIYEQPAVGDVEYIFKHALTQEVAYNSVLMERRRVLHDRAGAAIEVLYADHLDDRLAELAHHFARSANASKAIEYLGRAGGRAVERSAYVEAVSHFSAALELLRAMPHSPQRAERELALLLALGPAVQVTKGWSAPEAEAVYLRARELCREVGETPQLFPALFGLAAYYAVGGEYKPAREIMDECLILAQRSGDSNMLVQAYHQLGWLQTCTGELASARQSQDELITRYDSKKHHSLAHLYGGDDPAVCCLGIRGLTLWLLGYPEQALQAAGAQCASRSSYPTL
jgi:predicted ATPase